MIYGFYWLFRYPTEFAFGFSVGPRTVVSLLNYDRKYNNGVWEADVGVCLRSFAYSEKLRILLCNVTYGQFRQR